MKAVCYLSVKFPKQTVLNLTKLGFWDSGSIIKIIVKVLYHLGNIGIVLYHDHFGGANP